MGPNTETVDNPYGLMSVWSQGDFLSRSLVVILVVMSVATWFIALTKLWDQSRLQRQYQQMSKSFWTGSSLRDGLAKLQGKDNIYRGIVEGGLRATEHHEGRLTDQIPLHEWVTVSLQRAVDQISSRLRSGLSFLATVGSTAPFVGLLGTVYGILQALLRIGVAGQASIDKVAGPVGEALIMTAIGLIVAVPAVLFYNWLLGRNKAILEQVRYFSTDIHSFLISGSRVDADSPPVAAPRPAAAAAAAAAARK